MTLALLRRGNRNTTTGAADLQTHLDDVVGRAKDLGYTPGSRGRDCQELCLGTHPRFAVIGCDNGRVAVEPRGRWRSVAVAAEFTERLYPGDSQPDWLNVRRGY